jgi:uncharacterized protein (TIGR03435 family)
MLKSTQVWLALVALLLASASSQAQTRPNRPQFEVASVKPAAVDEANARLQMMLRQAMRASSQPGVIPMATPGRIRLENWAMLDLIAAAYRVRATQVSGPSWIAEQGFDIEAKVLDGTQKEQLNGMLQSLLEERFGLKVHRTTHTRDGFALVVGKNGPKLKPEDPLPPDLTPEQSEARRQEQARARRDVLAKQQQEYRENGTPMEGFTSATFRSITTEALASQLSRFAEAPVVDETGLTGKYSVTLATWKNAPDGTIFDAVAKLGLKLEPRKMSIETVVVDQVSKTPTAN